MIFIKFIAKFIIGTLVPIITISFVYYIVYNIILGDKSISFLSIFYYSYMIIFIPLTIYSLSIILFKITSIFYIIIIGTSIFFLLNIFPAYLNDNNSFFIFLSNNLLSISINIISGVLSGAFIRLIFSKFWKR